MKRILIAEDDYVAAELFKHILSVRFKQDVIGVVHSSKEAVKKIRELKPDMVFLDIKMEHKTSGLDACREIKNEFPEIKVFLLTAYAKHTFRKELEGIEYDGYIDKLGSLKF